MKFTEWLYLTNARTFDECLALETLHREYVERGGKVALDVEDDAPKLERAVESYSVFPGYTEMNPDFTRVRFTTYSDPGKVEQAVRYCAVACLRGESVDEVNVTTNKEWAPYCTTVEFYFDSTKSHRHSPVVQWFSEFAAMMEDKFDIAIESITVWVL